jgi:TetR/AcrR family transcriptional regulator, mexJK operon transcriptional repressor
MQLEPISEVTSQRERILAAARSVFLEGPPEQATMDAVAQRAGMSKKTIYREFKSQLELLAALMAEQVSDLGEVTLPTARSNIEQELYALIVRIMSSITSAHSMALVRLIISEIRRYPELMNHQKPRNHPSMMIADWLAAPAVQARYLIEDPCEAAAMLMGMVMQDSGFKLLVTDTGGLPIHLIEGRTRRAVAIFLRGVKKTP